MLAFLAVRRRAKQFAAREAAFAEFEDRVQAVLNPSQLAMLEFSAALPKSVLISLLATLKLELSELCSEPIRFEWSTVSSELAMLSKGLRQLTQLVETDSVEAFKKGMGSFVSEATDKMAKLDALAKETTDLCVDLGTECIHDCLMEAGVEIFEVLHKR